MFTAIQTGRSQTGSGQKARGHLSLRGVDVSAPARPRPRGLRLLARVAPYRALARDVCAAPPGAGCPTGSLLEIVTHAGDVRSGAALIVARGHERELPRCLSALWDGATDAGSLDLPG